MVLEMILFYFGNHNFIHQNNIIKLSMPDCHVSGVLPSKPQTIKMLRTWNVGWDPNIIQSWFSEIIEW
jgi:hypothetical protein